MQRTTAPMLTMTLVAVVLVAGARAQQRPQHGRLFPPEDLGLLEGPDRDIWQRPDQIMDALQHRRGQRRRGSRRRRRLVHDPTRAPRRSERQGLRRGHPARDDRGDQAPRPARGPAECRDRCSARASDPDLPTDQLDAVLIVDAYHEMEQPVALLRNVAQSLKPNGRIGIVDFTRDGGGPGPPMEERVDPERVIRDAEAAGLRADRAADFLRYQYLLVFGKQDDGKATAANDRGSGVLRRVSGARRGGAAAARAGRRQARSSARWPTRCTRRRSASGRC